MVDCSSSKRSVSIQFRLAVIQLKFNLRISNLIGKGYLCRRCRCQIEAGLIRGKVANGKARYLLNIVCIHLDVQVISFPYLIRV
jgi:hypothetical protein